MAKEKSAAAGKTAASARRYTTEQKASAVRMVRTLRAELGTEHGVIVR